MKKKIQKILLGIIIAFFLVNISNPEVLPNVEATSPEDPVILFDDQFTSLSGWTVYPGSESYHSLGLDSGNGIIYEDNGACDTRGYAIKELNLDHWVHDSDLNIEVEYRAKSNYYGSSRVTHFRIGIMDENYNILWSAYQGFTYNKDSGWLILEKTIPFENLEGKDELFIYFGYHDSWSANWHNEVDVDYITIEGDMNSGVLFENQFTSLNGWAIYPGSESYHSLGLDSGYGIVYEDDGACNTQGYALSNLNLDQWAINSDLNLEVKYNAKSNYYGYSRVTHFRIGIMDENFNILWSAYEGFRYTKETGWRVLEKTIPFENLAGKDNFFIYFGYYDSWSANWHNEVNVDYITIEGGISYNNNQGVFGVVKDTSDNNLGDIEVKMYHYGDLLGSDTTDSAGQYSIPIAMIESAITVTIDYYQYGQVVLTESANVYPGLWTPNNVVLPDPAVYNIVSTMSGGKSYSIFMAQPNYYGDFGLDVQNLRLEYQYCPLTGEITFDSYSLTFSTFWDTIYFSDSVLEVVIDPCSDHFRFLGLYRTMGDYWYPNQQFTLEGDIPFSYNEWTNPYVTFKLILGCPLLSQSFEMDMKFRISAPSYNWYEYLDKCYRNYGAVHEEIFPDIVYDNWNFNTIYNEI